MHNSNPFHYRIVILKAAFNCDDITVGQELSSCPRDQIDDLISHIMITFTYNEHFNNDFYRLRCLAHISDEATREKFANIMNAHVNQNTNRMNAVESLPIAKQLHHYMSFHHLSLEQALAWSIKGDTFLDEMNQKYGITIPNTQNPDYQIKLSGKSVSDAHARIQFTSTRDILINTLNSHQLNLPTLNKTKYDGRFQQIIQKIKAATSLSKLFSVLEIEMRTLQAKPNATPWVLKIIRPHYEAIKTFKQELRKSQTYHQLFSRPRNTEHSTITDTKQLKI